MSETYDEQSFKLSSTRGRTGVLASVERWSWRRIFSRRMESAGVRLSSGGVILSVAGVPWKRSINLFTNWDMNPPDPTPTVIGLQYKKRIRESSTIYLWVFKVDVLQLLQCASPVVLDATVQIRRKELRPIEAEVREVWCTCGVCRWRPREGAVGWHWVRRPECQMRESPRLTPE